MPRRERATRIPRPAEPPPGYDGPYTSTRKILMSRRPRPSGAPPLAVVNGVRPSMDQVLPQVDEDSRLSKRSGSAGVKVQGSAKNGDEGRLLDSVGKEIKNCDGPAAVGHGGTPPCDLGAIIVPARKGAAPDGVFSHSRSFATMDPLLHSGHWIPAEYHRYKLTPWTGCWTCCGDRLKYTTKCEGFDARAKQLKADHERDIAVRKEVIRQQSAAEFRAQWRAAKDHDTAAEMRNGGIPAAVNSSNSILTEEAKVSQTRPFSRKAWVDRQARRKKEESAVDVNNRLSGETSSPQKLLAVRRDHVRSVIHLALSDARFNAFVAIDSLEGLLAVIAEAFESSEMNTLVKGMQSEISTVATMHTTDSSSSTTTKNVKAMNKRHDSGNLPWPSSFKQTGGCLDQTAEQQDMATSASSSADHGRGRQVSNSGAGLCLSLGALPAILGCLHQHTGHVQIEGLAMKLLQIFSVDPITTNAIKGNADVAAVCAARICLPEKFRSGGIPAASADPKGVSDIAEQACTVFGGDDDVHVTDSDGGDGNNRSADVSGTEDELCTGARETLEETTTSAYSALAKTSRSKTSRSSQRTSQSVVSAAKVFSTAGVTEKHGNTQGRLFTNPIVADESCYSEEATGSVRPGIHVHASSARRMGTLIEENVGTSVGVPVMSASVAAAMFVLSVAIQDSPKCQRLVLRERGLASVLGWLRGDRCSQQGTGILRLDDPRATESCLRILQELTRNGEERQRVMNGGGVEVALSAMEKFRSDHGVLIAGMSLLVLLGEFSEGRRRFLNAGGVTAVFLAMQRLVGEATLQVKGTDMLQKLINEESQARLELDGIKGGWQWLCQGTPGGNALVRYAPGEKQIVGWTVSQEQGITTSQALATTAAPEWTSCSLARFMGRDRNGSSYHAGSTQEYYFRVIKEAALLPYSCEGVEEWRLRTRRYEEEHHVRVNSIIKRRIARDNAKHHSSTTGSPTATSIPC